MIAGRPPVQLPPRPKVGWAVYGCFNRPSKIDRRAAALFAALLQHDPGGRLLLGSALYDEPGARRRVETLLREAGASLERVEIFGACSWDQFLAYYDRVDVALDTPSFSGGLTSLDALLQGAPVAAILGDRPAGRITGSLLTAMGLEGLIARSEEEMVALAVALAHDDALSAALRMDMRRRFLDSPLTDAVGFHRALADKVRALLLEKYPEAA